MPDDGSGLLGPGRRPAPGASAGEDRARRGPTRRQLLVGGVLGAGLASRCTPAPKPSALTIDLPALEDGERKEVNANGLFVELHRTGATVQATVMLCTHQGCRVRWDGEGYACPCHGGYYSADGKPKLGPPRRALKRTTIPIEGERVSLKL